MQMQVETFEELETNGLEQEKANDPAALELIERLGLEGQKSRVGVDQKTRCPFREMTVKERRVYETLFPRKVALAKYDSGMIPVRVLQVAAHAVELGIYKEIQVWCEDTKPRDPVLVGVCLEGDSWNKPVHILARWGEALEPFEALLTRAVATICDKVRFKARDEKAKAEAALADPTVEAFKYLGGDFAHYI